MTVISPTVAAKLRSSLVYLHVRLLYLVQWTAVLAQNRALHMNYLLKFILVVSQDSSE